MIVTSADSHMGLISLQKDHQKVALQLARKFGDHQFPELNPREFLEYLCGHLDEGWSEIDFETPNDPELGLPCDFRSLPFEPISCAWEQSIAQLSTYHPFCGMLASLHYCRRGESGSDGWQANTLRQFIDSESTRQSQLKLELAGELLTEHFIDPKFLETCLTQLDFLDALALDLISGKADSQRYIVPDKEEKKQVITLEKLTQSTYCLSPFPFSGNKLEVCVRRFCFPTLRQITSLNYRNMLPELDQLIDTIQIFKKSNVAY